MEQMYANPDELMQSGMGDMDEDFDEQYMEEPSEEVLDEWAKDEAVQEIIEHFQDDSLQGTKQLKFRDVYKLMEVLGLDHSEFVSMFTERDDDFDDLDGDDEDNGEFGMPPPGSQRGGGRGTPYDQEMYGGGPGPAEVGARGGGRGGGPGGRFGP